MLDKNAPEVCEKVKKYMLENMDFSGHEIPAAECKRRPFVQAFQIFREEKAHEIRRDGARVAFENWIRGLCWALDIYPVYCSKAADLVAEWREMTAAEREELGDDAGDRQFVEICYFVFRRAVLEEMGF